MNEWGTLVQATMVFGQDSCQSFLTWVSRICVSPNLERVPYYDQRDPAKHATPVTSLPFLSLKHFHGFLLLIR